MKKIAMCRLPIVFVGLLSASLVPLALGQDTGGVAPSTTSATVFKGRAPVAKDLLKVRFPKPISFRLSNGVAVYVLENHRLPSVRFSLDLRAGSIFETKPGVASTTAALLTEGTTTKDSLHIAESLEDLGAGLSVNASLDSTTVAASGLSESTDALLALMADVLLHPTFPADRLDRFVFSQRSMLSQRRTNPTGLAAELTSQVFYGGTKYSRLTPTREEFAAIKPEDLAQFREAFYRPDGAILGVTGDVDTRALKGKLEATFKDWKAVGSKTELPSSDFKSKSQSHIFLIDRPGSAQTVLQFGSLAVKETDPDYIPLTIANRILGGGSSGRLFQNIRERKGYTYGAYSSLTGARWPGIWGANASVRTEVTEPATFEFFAEFKRLQNEPVAPDELVKAKRSIIGGFARTLESPEGILARTIELVQNDLPLNYWDLYPERIQAITADDVQRVAKKYFSGNQIQMIVVGERSKIETGLAKYGTVEIVDPQKIKLVTSD